MTCPTTSPQLFLDPQLTHTKKQARETKITVNKPPSLAIQPPVRLQLRSNHSLKPLPPRCHPRLHPHPLPLQTYPLAHIHRADLPPRTTQTTLNLNTTPPTTCTAAASVFKPRCMAKNQRRRALTIDCEHTSILPAWRTSLM